MSEPSQPPWVELAEPGVVGLRDDGPALLDGIAKDLQVDDEWIVRTARTLTWWGEPTPITFTVDQPGLIQGDPTIKLTAAVTMAVEVTAATSVVLAAVDELNHLATVGAVVWLEEERRVEAVLTHYAYRGIEPITQLVTAFALVLYGEAMSRAGWLAEQVGGTPGVPPHPVSGEREDFDEMMTFTADQVLPAGSVQNRWWGGELEGVAQYLSENEVGIAGGGDSSLTVEFPLARNDAERYTRLRSHHMSGGDAFTEDSIAEFFSMPTALEQLMCVDHPHYGAGLTSLLRFPVRTRDDALAFANDLNLGEYRGRTGFPAIGAWCADGDGVAHTAFMANYFHRDWVAPNLASWAAIRTRWAFEAMAPDLIERQ